MEINKITETIIGCAIEVHRHLGSGLLESAYEECLAFELELHGLRYQRQVPCPVFYKGKKLEKGYVMDLLVESKVVAELKSVDTILEVHEAQVLTYLKFSEKHIGLLINFNVPVLYNGVKRFIN